MSDEKKISILKIGTKGEGGLIAALDAIMGGEGMKERRRVAEERRLATMAKMAEAKLPKLDQDVYLTMYSILKGDSFDDFFGNLVFLTQEADNLMAAKLAHDLMAFINSCVDTLKSVDTALGTRFMTSEFPEDQAAMESYGKTLQDASEALAKVEAKHALAASVK